MSDTQLSTERAFSAEQLIAQAIGKGLPVETMERLLAMRQQLKAEQARGAFFLALASFQSHCPSIAKTKAVAGRDGKVRYRYAPLDVIVEQVKGSLEKYGFSYTIKTRQDKEAVTAMCEAHHSEGHVETSEFSIPIDPTAYMNDAQKVASAMTYAKRYAFCNAFGLMTADEDDDGASVDDHEPPARQQRPVENPPPKTNGHKRPEDQQKLIVEIARIINERNMPEGERETYRQLVAEAKTTEELIAVFKKLTPPATVTPPPQPAVVVEVDPKPTAKSQRESDMEKLERIRKQAMDAKPVSGPAEQQEMDIAQPIDDQIW